MGGAAFQLLKRGRTRLESSKQAEIRLASLLKILRIPGGLEAQEPCRVRTGERTRHDCICRGFAEQGRIHRKNSDLAI
jgi:hypothetical protein